MVKFIIIFFLFLVIAFWGHRYYMNITFKSLINEKPSCINYYATKDGESRLGIDVNQVSNFCMGDRVYEDFLLFIKESYYSFEATENIDLTAYLFFRNIDKLNSPPEEAKSYVLGKNWVSLCQHTDFLGGSSCMVHTFDNPEQEVNDFLQKLMLFHNEKYTVRNFQ